MATDHSATSAHITDSTDSHSADGTMVNHSESESSRALAVKSPQYLQLSNKAGTESEYIRDGWSWGGFSFGAFWLIRHRIWRSIVISLLALIAGGAAILASVRLLGSTDILKAIATLTVASLVLVHVFLGRHGNFWRQSSLVDRGWVPVRKIFAKNIDEATEVGESALSDLPAHRVPTLDKEATEGKPELPELRPLLKTGEPEIRTVRRPESQQDISANRSLDGANIADRNNTAASEETNATWKVASKRIGESANARDGDPLSSPRTTAKNPRPDTERTATTERSQVSKQERGESADSLISDTSLFDAPTPVVNTSKVNATDQPSDQTMTDGDAAERQTKTANSKAQFNSRIPTEAAQSNDPQNVDPQYAGKNGDENRVRTRVTEDPNSSVTTRRGVRKYSAAESNSPEAMFERTLGSPRKRNTDTSTAAVADEKDATRLTTTQDIRQNNSVPPTNGDSSTQAERVRLEPTLRPKNQEATRPATAATTETSTVREQENRRKVESENNELFEVAWNEIENDKMVAALEARALTQHPDNPDQRKALYIRMRVAQLREERLLAREEIAAQRRRRAQKIAELEREEIYRDFVQIIQPDETALRHAKSTLANFARSENSDTDLSLKVLNDAVESIGMTVVFAPMAGYVAECTDGQMLELGNREQLNEFLMVLMNKDQRAGTASGSNGSAASTDQNGRSRPA